MPAASADAGARPEVVAALLESRQRFLAFLERRLGSRAEAEELLQTAFLRALRKGGSLRDTRSAVAWFFRLLRNATTDHRRRAGLERRLFAGEPSEAAAAYQPELKGEVCACLRGLLPALKPEYAEILERVDLQEQPLRDAARALGLRPNTAAVRLHRARAGLRRQLLKSCGACATHGCLDCRCSARRDSP